MTREQAEQEARAINGFIRNPGKEKCDECGGGGRNYQPLYGDPGLGYSDAGPCLCCRGTGDKK